MSKKIAVVGLGYVGLPVAVAFAKKHQVIGFDKNEKRVSELQSGFDRTREVEGENLKNTSLLFTADENDLSKANVFIVAVPTPINEAKHPDLTLLIKASETIGKHLKDGDIVIYESTVYPGTTEDECGPVLEHYSGLVSGKDFTLAYSPERINPGDKEHRFETITKIVSGQDQKTLDIVAELYESVVTAGVHRAPDIKTAEAAKVIENTQRDLNIALMNELSVIFNRLGIDTHDVIEAASTKWNFLPFKPGLVGGHCIGVDPYYLTYQAQRYGYQPEVILAGRRINDNTGKFVAQQTLKKMIHAGCHIKSAKVGVLGLTFKENCPDLRNTRVIDIIHELESYGIECHVHGAEADHDEAKAIYGLDLKDWNEITSVDALVLAVPHNFYREQSAENYKAKFKDNALIMDVKACLDRSSFQAAGIELWRM